MKHARSVLNEIPDKDVRRSVRDLIERGWTAKKTNGGHLKLTHPGGASLFCSATPSDYRAWANVLSNVRQVEREYTAD